MEKVTCARAQITLCVSLRERLKSTEEVVYAFLEKDVPDSEFTVKKWLSKDDVREWLNQFPKKNSKESPTGENLGLPYKMGVFCYDTKEIDEWLEGLEK